MHLVNAGNGQTATHGTNVATAPSVVVRDYTNNPVAGATVTFAVTATRRKTENQLIV